jgi:transposase
MAAALLPDPLWNLVRPFLPIPPRRPQGGRPRVSDRGAWPVLYSSFAAAFPGGCSRRNSGVDRGCTCWRRLRDWQRAGVWDLIHFALLDWLARSDQIDWSRAVMDSCSIRAVYGGDQTGPNPTDRAKRGSKRHLICDGQGVPRRPPDRCQFKRLARSTGLGGCDSPTSRHMRSTAPATGLCARGSRLRRAGDSASVARASNSPVRSEASYQPREWPRAVAVGGRADVCVAELVSPLAHSV